VHRAVVIVKVRTRLGRRAFGEVEEALGCSH
jgi:hypothetical protein